MNIINDYGLNEYFIKEASVYPNLLIARIIAKYKGYYKIVFENNIVNAKVSGKFINNVKYIEQYPVVGDFVMISFNGNLAIIEQVLNRRTILSRGSVSKKNTSQIIAANLDIVFICMSLNNNFNLNRLERYLTIVFQSGAIPIIILTKSDLCEDIDSKVFEIQCIAGLIDIIVTSIFDKDIENKIFSFLKMKMCGAFIGSSGVGKSTLINKLMNQDLLKTKEIGKDDKGVHTTSASQMFSLSNNSLVIDTPGIREISLDDDDLSSSFSDIEELAMDCKFNNCSHIKEKGCAVLTALNNGLLDHRRYDNYIKLKREEKYADYTFKEIEVEKHQRMFKEIGGMKNARRYISNNDKRK